MELPEGVANTKKIKDPQYKSRKTAKTKLTKYQAQDKNNFFNRIYSYAPRK